MNNERDESLGQATANMFPASSRTSAFLLAHRENLVFVCGCALIVGVMFALSSNPLSVIQWLTSIGVHAGLAVLLAVSAPWVVGIGLLATLSYWPSVRWFAWGQYRYRRVVAEARRRETHLLLAGVSEPYALATILPSLTERLQRASLSLFSTTETREVVAYQTLAESYVTRLRTISDGEAEASLCRVAALNAQLSFYKSSLAILSSKR